MLEPMMAKTEKLIDKIPKGLLEKAVNAINKPKKN